MIVKRIRINGGSWFNSPRFLRSAIRGTRTFDRRDSSGSFRLIRRKHGS